MQNKTQKIQKDAGLTYRGTRFCNTTLLIGCDKRKFRLKNRKYKIKQRKYRKTLDSHIEDTRFCNTTVIECDKRKC